VKEDPPSQRCFRRTTSVPRSLARILGPILVTILATVPASTAVGAPNLTSTAPHFGAVHFGHSFMPASTRPATIHPNRAPVNIQVSHTDPSPAGEPSLGVNRYGTVVVDWEDQGALQNPLGPVGMAISNDSGSTFGKNITIQTSPASSFEYDVSTTAVSPNGTVWIGYGVSPGSSGCGSFSSDTHVTAVWSNGSAWSRPIDAIPCSKAGSGFLDRDWIASTPNGTVYEVVDDGNGNLWLSQAWDGVHFSAPKAIYNQNQITIAAFAWNDTLWGVGDLSTAGCQVIYSRDTGATWVASSALPAGCINAGISWDVVWGDNASLDLVYQDAAGTQFTRSSDLGAHWSTPTLVSGVVPSGTLFQTPTIAADPKTGAISIVWLDTRAGTSSALWNVYESDSADNGTTWSMTRLVSAHVAGTGAGFWPGDFIYNVVTPWGTSAAVWGGDDSTGDLQTFFAQLPIENASGGNLTVTVENATGVPLHPAQVTLDGRTSRTNSTGTATYFDLAPRNYSVTATYPGLGNRTAFAQVRGGSTTTLLIQLGGSTPRPLTARLLENRTSGNLPLSIAFSVEAGGGIPPYSFSWNFGDGTPLLFGNPLNHTFTSVGNFTTWVWVNDSARQGLLRFVAITALNRSGPPSPLSIHATVSAAQGIEPLSVVLSVLITGGHPPYAIEWTLGDGTRAGNVTSVAHTYLTVGLLSPRVWVNDSGTPPSRLSQVLSLDVLPHPPPPPLVVNLLANPTRGTPGATVDFRAAVSGGTGSYVRYAWDFGDGVRLSSTVGSVNHTFGQPGEFTASVNVTDSLDNHGSSTVRLSILAAPAVTQPGPATGFAGVSYGGWAIAGAAIASAASAIVFLVRRKRRLPVDSLKHA
jgi:hypothetical protein